MAIANPRIHIICGICGCNKLLTFTIKEDIDDDTNKKYHYVSILCENCGSLTGLDELIKQK
jgi:RNase P subunit RPR2